MFFCIRQMLGGNLISAVCLPLLVALLAVPAVFAQSASDELDDESNAAEEMKSDEEMVAVETGGYVTGEVLAVDTARKSLTLIDSRYGGEPHVIRVNEATSFATLSSLSDVGIGDTVTVDYFTMGDSEIAENIILEKRAVQEDEAPPLEKVLSD